MVEGDARLRNSAKRKEEYEERLARKQRRKEQKALGKRDLDQGGEETPEKKAKSAEEPAISGDGMDLGWVHKEWADLDVRCLERGEFWDL